MKKVFVIIVTYKGKRWYDKCFMSLRESTIPIHTIVIDNTPGDEDASYIEEHYPEVHLIKPKENIGFGRANNMGMRYALDNDCDYVFLLNQDAWLMQSDVLEQLIRISEQHPEYGILSPMHLTADEKMLSIQYENTEHDCSRQLVSDLYCNRLQDVYETDYVNAAAWLLPSRTLERVGGFNPLFYIYGEDDDFLHRVHFHKLKVGICPRLRVVHDHKPFSAGQVSFNKMEKELLSQLLNVNRTVSIFAYKRYFWRKWIVALCTGNKAQMIYWWRIIKYVFKHEKSIKTSREIVTTTEFAWIEKKEV